jgi:hypothetical protein
MARDIFCAPSLPIARCATVLHGGQHHAYGRDRLRKVEQKKQNNLRQQIGKTNPIED